MSGERRWTVLALIRWTAEHFASRGIESPRLDAECLLAHAHVALEEVIDVHVADAPGDRFEPAFGHALSSVAEFRPTSSGPAKP